MALESAVLTHVVHLSRRSAFRVLREPTVMFPVTVGPLIFFGVLAGGVTAAGGIPGFPAVSYTDFVFAMAFVVVALLAAVQTGTLLARDIELGFLDRLLLTPTSSLAILVGHLMGAAALVSLEVVVYLGVGLAVGVNIEAGVGGVFVLALLVVPFAVGIGGFSTFVALRTGSAEAVQGTFPLMFALMFLSSLLLPRDLIEADWFRTVATINPISYFIESVRSLIITGWDVEALARGFLVVAGTLAAGLTAATIALRGRVERT